LHSGRPLHSGWPLHARRTLHHARRTLHHARRTLHHARRTLHHARRTLHAGGTLHHARWTLHARRTSGSAHARRPSGSRRTSGTRTTHALRRTSGHRALWSSAVHDRLREPRSGRCTGLIRDDRHRPARDHDLVARIDGSRLHDLVTIEVRAVGRSEILELKAVADSTDLAVRAGDPGGLQAQVVAFSPADRHGGPIEGQQLRGLALFADRNPNHGAARD
jgi:hypothetical protein